MADGNILSDFGIDLLEEEIDDVIFQTNEFLTDATFTGSQGPFWWILQMCMALAAHYIRSNTMGIFVAAQMGRSVGEVANPLFDSSFLRSDALLRRFLFACILLIINHISFIKLLA